jgi:hypothetical protein
MKAGDCLLNPFQIGRNVSRRTMERNFQGKNVDSAYANTASRRPELRQHPDGSPIPLSRLGRRKLSEIIRSETELIVAREVKTTSVRTGAWV